MGKFLTPFVHRIIAATLILLFTIIYIIDASALENSQDPLLVIPVLWILVLLYPIIIWQEWRAAKKQEAEQQADADAEGDAENDTCLEHSQQGLLRMIASFIYLIFVNFSGWLISAL